MNIFVLDKDPKICAEYHCDKHVVKMILETAQILSTAYREGAFPGVNVQNAYRATHVNHPVVKWAMNLENAFWLSRLGIALSNEFTFRTGNTHLSSYVIHPFHDFLSTCREITPKFIYCGSIDFNVDSVVDKYRLLYIHAKANFARWTVREEPSWFKRL